MNLFMHAYFFKVGHMSCQGQVKGQNYMFHQFWLLRAELSYKPCANCSGRFYTVLVNSGVPGMAYECQGKGQGRSIMVIIQK